MSCKTTLWAESVGDLDREVRRAAACMDMRLLLGSSQPFAHDAATHVGQAEVAALEAIGEAQVVEAEQVQERGVEVVDVDGVARDAPADVVGGAVDVPTLETAARHPDREGEGMVVAAG